jgi:DNA-binding PadR family transcriptional regulator
MLSFDVYRTTPSVRKLCSMTGRSSSSTLYDVLNSLRKKGYIVNPYIRPKVFVPTAKADAWWTSRKQLAAVEKSEIWHADRSLVDSPVREEGADG